MLSSAGPDDGPKRIVVVDNDESFRALAARLLRARGYAVVGEAATVAEALELVHELRPDTVLADVSLPDGDGFALTRDLVALAQAPRVVLISGDEDPGIRSVALRAGARGFVAKDALTDPILRELISGPPG
jgi:DNA-binding NarL/FixJ family response regulator